ncbi:MAG TPA: DUF3499 family protein [Egibacteraceae bacterium]|nr:DUF3499 family protein [Egibacteraceae bacterium]
MADEIRTCARTGCRWPASASLSFRYASRQVWLLDLERAAHPSTYDLCPHHADSLTVPNGWARVDQRTPQPVVVEPAGRDLAGSYGPTVARPMEAVRSGERRNRYAQLWARLPSLAAEVAQTTPGGAPGPSGSREEQRQDVVLNDEGGQLAIPVDDYRDGDGVVVPIGMAGARRRGDRDG